MQFVDGFLSHKPGLGIEFNSLGHRCKELSELNLHNYILFAGDNVSLGLGTPMEETYPALVSSKLRTDYYNISIFNGGLDALRYNLVAWFSKIKKKPKAVVISSEFLNSLLVTDINYNSWTYCDLNNEVIKDLLHAGNMTGFFTARRIMAENQLKNLITVPIYQIVFDAREPALINNVTSIIHTGNMFDHVSIAAKVLDSIKKQSQKVKP